MAEAILTKQSLVIKYQSEIDKEGKEIYKRQGFSNISSAATGDNLCAIGNDIGAVLVTQIYSVMKENKFELIG